MAMLKWKAGHASAFGIFKYLYYDKTGAYRALGDDVFGILDRGRWWKEMDDTRRFFGKYMLGIGAHGKSREYHHFIISPDPADSPSLETVRQVVAEWIERCFDEGFQIAVVYHDDNSEREENGLSGIVHAHIVVNSVNSLTGMKLHVTDSEVDRLADTLQEVADSFGLSSFENNDRSYKKRNRHKRPAAAEDRNVERMMERGEVPFKEQVKRRVDALASRADSIESLSTLMATEGFGIERAKDDLVFVGPDGRRIRASRLGPEYTEQRLKQTRFVDFTFVRMTQRRYRSYGERYRATAAATARTDSSVAKLQRTVDVYGIIVRENIGSFEDFERRKKELEALGKEARTDLYVSNKQMQRSNEIADALRTVRAFEAGEAPAGEAVDEARALLSDASVTESSADEWLRGFEREGAKLVERRAVVDGTARRIADLENAHYVAYQVFAAADRHAAREREAAGLEAPRAVDAHARVPRKAPKAPREYRNARTAPYWKVQIKKAKYQEIARTDRAYRANLAALQSAADAPRAMQKIASREQQYAASLRAEERMRMQNGANAERLQAK